MKCLLTKLVLSGALLIAATPSHSLECLSEFIASADSETAQSVKEVSGIFEYRTSQIGTSISNAIAKTCDGKLSSLESYGVLHPENQLSIASQSVFLTMKYGGDVDVFLKYLADEYSQWEQYVDHNAPTSNANCEDQFQIVGTRVQEWTSGRLGFRSYPVGVCSTGKHFWLHVKGVGWRPLDPYEIAEVCVTLKLHNLAGLEYCDDDAS